MSILKEKINDLAQIILNKFVVCFKFQGIAAIDNDY